MSSSDENHAPLRLTLHLLDSALGHPVQTWQFENRDTITIGRGPDNDISLVDPQVSRCHVLFRYCDDQWLLVSIGRNGTRVNGMTITELPVCDQQIFQMGPTGPQFRIGLLEETDGHTATINSDNEAIDELFIDQDQQQQQVEQIIEGDAFQQLQRQVREFRDRQDVEDTQV